MTTTICRGCEASTSGNYCSSCGQRQPRPGDFSLRTLAGEVWSELSDTDSRLWRSVLGLFRPGLLTRAYLDYQWQRYLPPLRLYLVFSGIYFLLAWDVYFRLSIEQALSAPGTGMPAGVRETLQDPAATATVSNLTALLKFLFVVVMGYWIALLHWGSRQPIGAHMVFALHYTAMDFALFSLQAPLLALSPEGLQPLLLNLIQILGVLLLLTWAVVAMRVVYQRNWLVSTVRGALVLVMDIFLSTFAGQAAIAAVFFSRS